MTLTLHSAAPVAAITAVRDGVPLGRDTLDALVTAHLAGHVPDYQMAAWLMAVTCRGLTTTDTVALTQVLAATGTQLRLRDRAPFVADKHSTGGIGDKTTLLLAPLLASVGIPIGKLTGRSLEHHGGTVDKLEAISGLQLPATADQFLAALAATGIGLAGQSDDLAPGDGALYALRDVTGTVPSLPLIAASIMSKKLAVGASALVLDVKTGPGAVLTDPAQTAELAQLMADIGNSAGLPTRAVISDMSQPLGYAIGNALEVAEAVAALNGIPVPGLVDLTLELAVLLAQAAWPDRTADDVRDTLTRALADGSALAALRRWVLHHGGDVRQIDQPDRLPAADQRLPVTVAEGGCVHAIDATALGLLAADLGAGRARVGQRVDPAAGIQLAARVGDTVCPGQPLAHLHAPHGTDLDAAADRVRSAFTLRPGPATAPPLIHQVI